MKLETKKCVVCGRTADIFVRNLFDDRYGSPGKFDIYFCKKCGFGRTYPVLKKEVIGEFYKKYYPLSSISAREVKVSARVLPMFLAWFVGVDNTTHRHVKKGSDVLDIGSGSGVSLLEIEKAGSTAFGVEPDPNAQKIAKKLKLNVYKGFITDDPFLGRRFDFVTGSQVFEHEPDIFGFLNSAKKKLKPAGQIILGLPNFDSIYRKIFGRKWLNWHVPYHINFFTKVSFQNLAKKSGLKIIKIRTITPGVWTLMQIRSILIKVDEGQKNPIWTSAPSGRYIGGKSFSLKNFALRSFALVFYILIAPVNRLIDLLGAGDSLLVILESE